MRKRQVCPCGEYRNKAVKNGVCACCTAPKDALRIPKCPMCPRENAPFDKHHPFGRRAQEILGLAELTIDVCKNCHRVITAFLDPFMKAQRQFLTDGEALEIKFNAFLIGCVTGLAHAAKFCWKDDQSAKDLRDDMQRIVKYGIL